MLYLWSRWLLGLLPEFLQIWQEMRIISVEELYLAASEELQVLILQLPVLIDILSF